MEVDQAQSSSASSSQQSAKSPTVFDCCTDSKDRVHFLIVRYNPGNESKCSETCPYVVREPEQDEGENRKVAEKAVPRQRPAVGRRVVLRLMQSPKQDCRRQRCWPDKRRRIHKPPSCKAGKTESRIAIINHRLYHHRNYNKIVMELSMHDTITRAQLTRSFA